MSFQYFPPFLGTKYSNFLHFQKCGHSVLYDKDYIDSNYNYLETSVAHTILLA